MRPTLLAVILLVLALVGCDRQVGSDAVGYQVRDSVGIRIVESTSPAWTEDDAWRLGGAPILSIGQLEGAPEYQFNRVSALVRLADGRIAVANEGSSEVRFYDEAGRHLGSVGRAGAGPGEFVAMNWMGRLRGDSLLVHDFRQRRLTTISPAGEIVESVPLEADSGVPRVSGRFTDGTLLAHVSRPISSDGLASGTLRVPSLIVRMGTDGQPINPIVELKGSETQVHVDGRSIYVNNLFFGRATHQTNFEDRVFAGDSDRYEIGVYSSDGVLQHLIRRPDVMVPVTASDVAAARTTQLERATEPAWRQQLAVMLDEMTVPPTMPAFDDLLTDDLGNLWVRNFVPPGPPAQSWTVFDVEGRMLGTVEVSPQFTPMHIGDDFISGVWKDDLDVEYVRMFSLEKPV